MCWTKEWISAISRLSWLSLQFLFLGDQPHWRPRLFHGSEGGTNGFVGNFVQSVERFQDLLRPPVGLRPSGMPMSVPPMHLALPCDFASQGKEFAICWMSRKGIGCRRSLSHRS